MMRRCTKCGEIFSEGRVCPKCRSVLDDSSIEERNSKLKITIGRKNPSSENGQAEETTPSRIRGSLSKGQAESRVKTSLGRSRNSGTVKSYPNSGDDRPHFEEKLTDKKEINRNPTLKDGPGTIQFKRSTRIRDRFPDGRIRIPAPPAKLSAPEINWLSTLLPAGVTIVIAIIMALVFNSPMMMLYSLPMTIAGVVISIVNYMHGKKNYQKSSEARRTSYLEAVNKIEESIKVKREAQIKAMLQDDPEPRDCLEYVKSRNRRLWCREPYDTDFVSVRLGTGTVPFSVTLEYPRESLLEVDDLQKMSEEIYHRSTTIKDMPILCDIRGSGVIGVLGMPKQTQDQIQNMLLHLATHHCCTDLKLVCFYNEENKDALSWLSRLPHTHGLSADESYLASSQAEADALFRSFTDLFMQRKQEVEENNSYGSGPMFIPYVLFVFFEPRLLKKTDPINRYLFMEHDLGVGCLMAAQTIAQLPKQCTEIISLTDAGGEIYSTARASEIRNFSPDAISTELRMAFGKAMEPLYCDEGLISNSLPKNYSFYQMLGITKMSEYDIGANWRASDLAASSLAPSAPIGVRENGDRIFFNSPPTADNGGAHALVAGAAGSGKSEVLLTIILSLALRYPPNEVGFLVIDFKGDSIASSLTGLPHLRGVITNLDGDQLRRSLVSINAEIDRRQRIFKEYNDRHPEEKEKIKDILHYTERYRCGKVKTPMPHLFIVVDEFATLKKQLPDIMEQFVDVAQRGRSLGIKLILATQSPAGVVDAKIRANILKYLCLKVANASESREMLGVDLAKSIKEPGRGYLMVDESWEVMQSAYGGGKLRLADGTISTQICEVVDAIASYCHSQNILKLPDLFCPMLPEHVDFSMTCLHDSGTQLRGDVPIGIRDDPATQFMGVYNVNVFARNTMIVGSQMMGKTNLLQTILRSTATLYSPEDVNVYILDFASLFLKNYEDLPHVGGVVTSMDTEKFTNLFRLLKEQIELRRQKFISRGVGTFSAYWESGGRDLPQILLLIDNLAAVKERFTLEDDPLLLLCKDGLGVGISVIATALQPVGISTYLPTFANRIVLYNNDSSVYITLFNRSCSCLKELPGRCMVSMEKNVYECQSFLAFDGQREFERTEAIHNFCRKKSAEANGKRAAAIPYIPENYNASDAFSAYPELFTEGRVMLGLDYGTVKPLFVKLAALRTFAISGRDSGVRNFQRWLITSAQIVKNPQMEFYIVDDFGHALRSFADSPCVKAYSFLSEQAATLILQVKERAEERYSRVLAGDVSVLDSTPTIVLMLNTTEAINTISSDKDALGAWRALTGHLKDMNICILFGNLDNVSIPFGSEVLKKIKEDRKLLFFDNLGNLKIGDLPYATIKNFPSTLPSGDGYFIIGNEIARIRIPDCPESNAN